jgi:hypothetical protein
VHGPRLLRQLGPDRVVAIGRQLEIWSSRPNDGWEVRTRRRVLVRFEGERWTMVSIRREPPSRDDGHVVYTLERFAASAAERAGTELVGTEVDYDEAFVEARERQAISQRSRAQIGAILTILSPFLGFAWSGAKRRLHERYGLHPLVATRRSMALQAAVTFATALFFGTNLVWIVVFPLDLLLRFHSILADEWEPWGFGEWTVGFFRGRRDAGRYPLEEERERAAVADRAQQASAASAFVAQLAGDRRLGEGTAVVEDRLFRDGHAFVIHSAVVMEGWEPRRYRKMAVAIDGVRCHVVEALVHDRPVEGVRARYRLEPWPAGFHDLPLAEVRYDADFVLTRRSR